MAISGAVYARIVSQYSDKGSKAAQRDIQKTAARIDKFNKRIVKSYLVAGAAVAAFALKLGKDAVQGAMADEKQQAALAVALRNTTGATDAAIAANVEYLDSLELQVAIDNEQLIPALQKLVTATGDLALGQKLLTLATDVSAASGKDLSTVSTALSRAFAGNFTSLNKLGLPLDQNAIKAKNLSKILQDLGKISAGQAAAAANTFSGRLEKLRLSVAQVADKVGYALIPFLKDFAVRIETEVVPAIEKFVEANQELITQSLVDLVKTIERIAVVGLKLVQFLSRFETLLVVFASLAPLGFLAAQLTLVFKAVSTGGKFFKNLYAGIVLSLSSLGRFVVSAGALASVFTTGGLATGFQAFIKLASKAYKPLAALVTIIAILVAGVKYLAGILNTTDNALGKTTRSLSAQAERARSATRENRLSREELKKKIEADKKALAVLLANAKAQAKALAEQKKSAKFEADYAKLNEKLAKTAGVKLLSSEDEKLVQINAAIALQDRQKATNAINQANLARLKEEVLLQKVRNDLSIRYLDILRALADNEVTSKEVQILALKWGVTQEAVEAYLLQLQIVEDGTISDKEIIQLAQSWGSTQAQAAQYLDFFVALNDGVLSDAEIEKLKAKWKLTGDQVRMYADFVGVVNDGKLEDAEIEKLKAKWKLTTDQVVDYIKKIGSPVSYSGTLIDPARAAEIGWLSATAALQRYLDLLKAGTGVVTTAVTAAVTTTDGNSAAAIAAAAIAAVQAADAADEAAAILAESEDELARILKEAADAAAASAQFTEELTNLFPELMKSVAILEASQAAKETSGRSYTTDAELDRILGGSRSDSAASIDEGFRFKAFSPTMASASGGGFQNSMAGNVTVIVNNAGSVLSEQDLATSIRNSLLSTQYNGNPINLQAV